MNAVGPQRVPTEWVARLANLVATLRSDWDEAGIRSVLHRVTDRPLGDVTIAAVTAALTRTDQRTPAVIATTGKHWPSYGAHTYAEPGIVTICEHDRPGVSCAECHPRERVGVPMPDDVREKIRAGIVEGQAAIAARTFTPGASW